MPKKRASVRKAWSMETLAKSLQSVQAKCWYALLAGWLALTVLFCIAIAPERYSLNVGDISHTTITASKDVVDEISTARQRETAARQVEPTYLYKEGVTAEVMQNLYAILTQCNAVQQYGRNALEQYAAGDRKMQNEYVFSDVETEYAKSLLTQISFERYQLNTLLRATDQQMADMDDNMTAAVENTLNTTIREGYVNESIQYLQQIIGYKTDMDLLQNVVTPILRKVIQPNMVIDQDATAKLQEEARAAVEPVIYKQGQNIVVARERVTANQLEMLRSLGLLDSDSVDIVMYVGGALMVTLAMLALLMTLLLFKPALLKSPKKLWILIIILCVTLALCICGKLIHLYLMPVLLGAMMLTGLIGPTAGAAGAISLAMLVSALVAGGDSTYGTEMVNILLTSIIGGFTAVIVIRQKPNRQQVLLAGLAAAAVNIVTILTIGFMTNTSVTDVLANALWSGGSAIIAALLCVGFDPLVETAFHLATPSKLLELCNPNQPLMRRLLIEAPGTYHHSIIVANLSEAAAEAIGANPLLARAGAYYHDIGKLKRPLYFKENQMGENPHEHTNPYVSAAIVTAHTRDGLMMAQQSRLPEELQQIVTEHHGDTPVMYFYHKALQQAAGQPIDIADFRYDGRRPTSKESAIVMLADTVEAAVRSMPDPTPKGIEAFIVRLVRGKLEDGQLSQAPITLSDIDRICEAFSTVLNGVFHERIEYPTLNDDALTGPQQKIAAPAAPPAQPEESHVEAMELQRIAAPNEETQDVGEPFAKPTDDAPEPDPAGDAPEPTEAPVENEAETHEA